MKFKIYEYSLQSFRNVRNRGVPPYYDGFLHKPTINIVLKGKNVENFPLETGNDRRVNSFDIYSHSTGGLS